MTINIGFIGTGGFTRHHVQILSSFDHVNVVGFVGSSQEKAEKFAEEFSGTNGYASLEEMMAKEKLDAVYICVPPMGHESYEKTLIENQIPFFCRKTFRIRGRGSPEDQTFSGGKKPFNFRWLSFSICRYCR